MGAILKKWLMVLLAFAASLGILLPNDTYAQPIDRWHYIDNASVLHTERVDGLHGAGIIQSDRIFAMLYLGLPEDNGVVTVALPTRSAAAALTSTLVATNGQRFERTVDETDMDVAQINDETFAYSVPISWDDVRLFKSALTWHVKVEDDIWSISLSGSQVAIEKAVERSAAEFRNLSSAPQRKIVPD